MSVARARHTSPLTFICISFSLFSLIAALLRAHHTGNCIATLLFHRTVRRAAPRCQRRRSLHLGRRWEKPRCDLCNTRNSQHRKPFNSAKARRSHPCCIVRMSDVRQSARRAPAKIRHLMVLKPPNNPAPGSSREATFDCPWPTPCHRRPAEAQATGAILEQSQR